MKCARCGKRLKTPYYHGAIVYGPECIRLVIKQKHGQHVRIKAAESSDLQMGLFDGDNPANTTRQH